MTLADQLDRLRSHRAAMPEWVRVALDDALERQLMLQLAEGAPAVGEPFPDFALSDASGRVWCSGELLARGPLLVLFFRGGWCPYCDATIRAVDEIANDLAAIGIGLIGILPEGTPTLAETEAEKGVSFPLLSDTGGALARVTGLGCTLTQAQIDYYGKRQGLDLPARHAGTGWELPVPAAYLLDPDGTVAFGFADPDYTRRAEPRALLEAARRLVGSG